LYAHVLYGHSTGMLNSALVFVRALAAIWRRPPGLVLLGSVERTVPWFIQARKLGLLRGAKLVVTNQLNLSDEQLDHIDRVIVYASAQAAKVGPKGVFLRLPADGDLAEARRSAKQGVDIFSGGGAGRDFATLIEAVRGTALTVEIVTFDPSRLDGVPANVRISGPVPPSRFLAAMAGAAAVVVLLDSASSPHGQTTVVQALALGKPVIATRSIGVTDYVRDGENGCLVEPSDVEGLRRTLLRLAGDEELRARLGASGLAQSSALSYRVHGDELEALCLDLL
jgi:glycosyltransferase involved in cell wall biosynthesis